LLVERSDEVVEHQAEVGQILITEPICGRWFSHHAVDATRLHIDWWHRPTCSSIWNLGFRQAGVRLARLSRRDR
jgi:hypothetical protein